MFARWQAEQQAIVIFLYAKEINLRGVGKQRAVIVVYVAIYIIIGGIKTSGALQKLNLGAVVQAIEELDGLFGGGFVAMDRQGGIDNLLHATTDGASIVEGDRATNVQVYVVAIGNGDVDGYLAGVEKIVNGLTEHEEEAAGIGSRATGRGDVEKFDLFLFVDTIVHALHLIINMGRDRAIFHLQT